MANIQLTVIVVAVVVGMAIGGALFLLYPDTMFGGTNIAGQSGFETSDDTMTAASPDAAPSDFGGAQP